MTIRKGGISEPLPSQKWYNSAVAATVVGVCLTALLAAAANFYGRLNDLEKQTGKIEQRLADGGTHEIVQELGNANDSKQVVAAMTTLHGEVLSASLNHAPNQNKIEQLTPAVIVATHKFPELAASWQTVATLASYRTSNIEIKSDSLPDCDISVKSRYIAEAEIPGMPHYVPDGYVAGFVFRNCKLHMNHLPPGYSPRVVLPTAPYPPKDMPAGTPVYQINEAFIVDCEIILNDSGIADSPITIFHVANSRLYYDIDHTPSRDVQKLLLASLDSPLPGGFTVNLQAPS